MKLVDKQYDLAPGCGRLGKYRLQASYEFRTVFGIGRERIQVETEDLLAL